MNFVLMNFNGNQSLNKIKNWIATQFRQFLFYIGVPVLKDLIGEEYLQNFLYLVVTVRTVASRVPKGPEKQEIIDSRSKVASELLRFFVPDCARLYGTELITHNFHNVIHITDNYKRFGELDAFSAFRFESKLGAIKHNTTSGFRPLEQKIFNSSTK